MVSTAPGWCHSRWWRKFCLPFFYTLKHLNALDEKKCTRGGAVQVTAHPPARLIIHCIVVFRTGNVEGGVSIVRLALNDAQLLPHSSVNRCTSPSLLQWWFYLQTAKCGKRGEHVVEASAHADLVGASE